MIAAAQAARQLPSDNKQTHPPENVIISRVFEPIEMVARVQMPDTGLTMMPPITVVRDIQLA